MRFVLRPIFSKSRTLRARHQASQPGSTTFVALLWGLMSFVLTLVFLISAYSAVAGSPAGSGLSSVNLLAFNTQTINGNPLTIIVGSDGSFQVKNAADPISPTGGQFYPTNVIPADMGVFLVTGNKVYGPDFDSHSGTASNSYDLFTQVSQSAVTGNGTALTPYKQITVLDVPGTAIRITQTTTYQNGMSRFNVNWVFSNSGNGLATPSFRLYFAGDIYFQGSDLGYGFYDSSTGSVGGYNQTNTAYLVFTPLTRPDAYFEGFFADVWDRIGSAGNPGVGFNNTIISTILHDDGAGLQWNNRSIGNVISSDVVLGIGPIPTTIPMQPTPRPQVVYTPPPDMVMQLRVDPNISASLSTPAIQSVVSYTLTVKNIGQGKADKVMVDFPVDTNLEVLSVEFDPTDKPNTWVTEVMTDTIKMELGSFNAMSNSASNIMTATIRLGIKQDATLGSTVTTRASAAALWSGGARLLTKSNSVSYNLAALRLDDTTRDTIQPVAATIDTTNNTVTVSGDIFIPKEKISGWINMPDGSVKAITSNITHADESGLSTAIYDLSGLTPGTYSIVLYGERSEVQGVGTFTISN